MTEEADMDLLEYYRREVDRMKQEGKTENEIEKRLDSMTRLQALVVMATI